MEEQFIELRILTGLIVSTDYCQQIRKQWDSKLLESNVVRRLAGWCIDYFDEYQKAPNIEIESIFKAKSKRLKEVQVEDIEDILADLSDEYERSEKFNVKYLVDQTLEYFEQRHLTQFAEDILATVKDGTIHDAKQSALNYSSPIESSDENLNLSDESVLDAISTAFKTTGKSVIKYPRALGRFWNDQLVRGGFVALMAPEKRGKTFLMLDMAIRAAKQRSNVAFFQAGDMTQEQQLKRIAIYLTKKSDRERYCEEHYEPVRDCIKNQMDDCTFEEREGLSGVFEDKQDNFFNEVTMSDLIKAHRENPDHKTCFNCKRFWIRKYGTPWVKKVKKTNPLTERVAKNEVKKLFVDRNLGFRLSSYSNGTLTVSEIENVLSIWEREDGFIPDVIIIDYADILAPEIRADFRHQENDKWKKLRGLSQKKNALVITATQADALSYNQNTLSLKNYSEDKRKFAHVTAMFGMNQDKKGREKEIGILRLNELVVREDDFSVTNQVTVLQNLKRGIPFISSY